jgi:hypothetical protein
LSNPPFETPQLYALKGGELSLSGQGLLELMRAVLAKGRLFRFCARGWSMAPFIRDGDMITVAPLSNKPPRIGEVIAFVHPQSGKLVVHRAVGVNEKGLLIQGDSVQGGSDGIVPYPLLLGTVTRIERNGKRVWIGLGMERYLIAWLSRTGMLKPLYDWLSSRKRNA